jgi:hypothetical protein
MSPCPTPPARTGLRARPLDDRRGRPTSRTDGRSPRGGAASGQAGADLGGSRVLPGGGGGRYMGTGPTALAKPGEDFAR